MELKEAIDFFDKPLFDGKYSSGRYTYKVYHVYEKLPKLARRLFKREQCQVHEESWFSFPFCETKSFLPNMPNM